MSKQRKRLEEMIEEEEGVIEGHPSGTPIVCYEHYEVRIPEQIDHSFRRKLTTDSTPN
jgi:hypothetical protein